jgi:hypothetical protein
MVSSTAPHALYVSDVFTAPQPGGAVIIYRHLQRLVKEGWRATVAAPAHFMRAIAVDACDPEKIHRQFLAELPHNTAP